MAASLSFCRRALLIGWILLVLSALILAAGVIPPVKTDTSSFATPESAVIGFWVNVIITLLFAAILLVFSLRTAGRSRGTMIVLGLSAFFAILLGLALLDAAFAFRSHGPALQFATALIFCCAAADILAALLVIVTMSCLPKRT